MQGSPAAGPPRIGLASLGMAVVDEGAAHWGGERQDRYETEGFVVLRNLLKPAGVAGLNTVVDQYLAEWAARPTSRSSSGGGGAAAAADWTAPWLFEGPVGDAVWQLATDPAMLRLMAEFCGPNLLLWAGGLALKSPARSTDAYDENVIPWHQDAPYWNIYPERHGVVWIALEPVSSSNGTMAVLPGTHRAGCYPRVMDEQRAGFNHNIDPRYLPAGADDGSAAFEYCFAAGDGAVHHIMLPHFSSSNVTKSPRRALNLRYCSAETVFGLGCGEYINPLTGATNPREFILVAGDDVEGRGHARAPSWRAGRIGYVGNPAVDKTRHERPLGEPRSYRLTNVVGSFSRL